LNLIIDIGNTRAKVAIIDNNEIIEVKAFDKLTIEKIRKLLQSFPGISRCIIGNVGKKSALLFRYLKDKFEVCIELSGNTLLPFTNLYESKSTQGADRIAAIAGTKRLFPETDVLIVDAGTAITIDFIDASGIYKGGNISPGIASRFKSLHDYTQQLPLLDKNEVHNLLGKNTSEAIEAGVLNGIVFEIEGYINDLLKNYKHLKTIITGGDAEFLSGKIKNTIFVESNLVLTGLNSILEHNVKRAQI
jgi:type III pantothenate kinase